MANCVQVGRDLRKCLVPTTLLLLLDVDALTGEKDMNPSGLMGRITLAPSFAYWAMHQPSSIGQQYCDRTGFPSNNVVGNYHVPFR